MYLLKQIIAAFRTKCFLFIFFILLCNVFCIVQFEHAYVYASEFYNDSIATKFKLKNNKKLHIVFFDDFNGKALSSNWKKITNTIPNPNNLEEIRKEKMKHHRSIYITDDDTCYVNNGCLVLKCIKDNSQYLGVFNDENYDRIKGKSRIEKERDYRSGYVSTQDSFAIPKGRISAKIKLSRPVTSGFAFTFFTFGQNNYWPKAPEFDIVEGTLEMVSKDRKSKSGIVYPAGSICSAIASHTHYLTNEGVEGVINGYHKIAMDNKIVFLKNSTYDETDWHEYAVEWDEAQISYYVDEVLVNHIDLLTLPNNTIFNSPADVRINIKARPWVKEEEAFLLVDWVKVESENINCVPSKISHDNVTLAVGQTYYVSPAFTPADVINCSYNMTSESEHIIIKNLLPEFEAVYHQIKAVSPGKAVVNLQTADGKCHGQFIVTVTE